MLRNVVFALSLLMNGVIGYAYYFPAIGTGPKMSCDEARSDAENKVATEALPARMADRSPRRTNF